MALNLFVACLAFRFSRAVLNPAELPTASRDTFPYVYLVTQQLPRNLIGEAHAASCQSTPAFTVFGKLEHLFLEKRTC
jgi:hypothetical protein